MKRPASNGIDPSTIVDRLYDIALDPSSLDDFMRAWNEAGLDSSKARQAIQSIDQFDKAYWTHLKRAERFQERDQANDNSPNLFETLTPFEGLAAFVVDSELRVVVSNEGAKTTFDIADGASLRALNLPEQMQVALSSSLSSVFDETDRPSCLLKVDLPNSPQSAVFQIRKLHETEWEGAQLALIVTTQYYWQAALGQTLEEVFKLTHAEQGVVRSLVEGMSAKEISQERGTSEGTVRGQIKSILAKTNARSQSEVIRLVMSLRDISLSSSSSETTPHALHALRPGDWLASEVWKPFKQVTLPDGRRMDYHDMGPIGGNPVLYSHMGFCMVRWHKPMLKLAFQHGLRIICPIRAGYGHSDNCDPSADILQITREDTRYLLDELGIKRLPYLTQGNDMLFAADFTANYPGMVSEIIGICARPSLSGDDHYTGMGVWHRFFLSTAKHAPHLLAFTTKAALSLAKRIGVAEVYRKMNQSSPADMAHFQDEEIAPVLIANAELIASKTTDVSQAFVMELLATEAPWADIMYQTQSIPTRFFNGGQDPSCHIAMIADFRENYPWIDIEVIPNAGQMLMYQHYDRLIPEIAKAAQNAAV